MSALWIGCQVIGGFLCDVCALWCVFVEFVWYVLCASVRCVYSGLCVVSGVCLRYVYCGLGVECVM